MAHHTDYNSIQYGIFAVEDADGSIVELAGYSIPILISETEVATLLAAYDQADSGSPTANTAREIARAVLDALKRYTGS